MRAGKLQLVFVSPVFLFPNDAGGKIRTTNILRGLRGGAFEITLVSVASAEQEAEWGGELASVCDRFVSWRPTPRRPRWLRAIDLLDDLPINIAADRNETGSGVIADTLRQESLDLVVFDFVHSAVLMPSDLGIASVCFTHNVEAEIFNRHLSLAGNPLSRWLWSSQLLKMQRFERTVLRHFTSVIAVSEKDARHFRDSYGVKQAAAIPTGVDLDFFSWSEPGAASTQASPTVVFTGSMDWMANIDGIEFFIDEVWPAVVAREPRARLIVVGRNPPSSLVTRVRRFPNIQLTGFVDDVRPYVRSAGAFVIPLRVGGGTRIKAFEAMAMGCPVVSTSIGMEGLEVVPGVHFLCSDTAAAMSDSIVRLLADGGLRLKLSRTARQLVEDRFGHRAAASVFERICLDALHAHRSSANAQTGSDAVGG